MRKLEWYIKDIYWYIIGKLILKVICPIKKWEMWVNIPFSTTLVDKQTLTKLAYASYTGITNTDKDGIFITENKYWFSRVICWQFMQYVTYYKSMYRFNRKKH